MRCGWSVHGLGFSAIEGVCGWADGRAVDRIIQNTSPSHPPHPTIHTAFRTTPRTIRLAPLPGAENNNKPGVKLPATLTVGGERVPLTILEAVLKQTGVYAPMRKGRLSVFWGDQVRAVRACVPCVLCVDGEKGVVAFSCKWR
jgi:hypothetical protein